jgi:hypothetical protein
VDEHGEGAGVSLSREWARERGTWLEIGEMTMAWLTALSRW